MTNQEHVSMAAAALDQIRPGWHSEINPNTLCLAMATRCILGQLSHGDQGAWAALAKSVHDRVGHRHFAFSVTVPDELWLAEIGARNEAELAVAGD